MKRLLIYDTTLRDGEQAPGFSMLSEQKLSLALRLSDLGVDIIEAGFPASSSEDFRSVKAIASSGCRAQISALARAVPDDIEKSVEALQHATNPRVHIFLSTSDIHMQYQLRLDRKTVLKKVSQSVLFAKSFMEDVQFSAMDATRSDPDFLCSVLEEAVNAGATTVNLSDTVGYSIPSEIYFLIKRIKYQVRNLDKAVLSVHCHNDLGLAVGNTVAAIEAGVDQVECTLCGIGERAGNAALEKIIKVLNVRRNKFNINTGIAESKLDDACRFLSEMTDHPELILNNFDSYYDTNV